MMDKLLPKDASLIQTTRELVPTAMTTNEKRYEDSPIKIKLLSYFGLRKLKKQESLSGRKTFQNTSIDSTNLMIIKWVLIVSCFTFLIIFIVL